MIFSSNLFLFTFLPAFLFCYFACPNRFRNLVILVSSLLFYLFCAGYILYILIFSIVFNYIVSKIINSTSPKFSKTILFCSILINLLFLLLYKYLGFLWNTVDQLFSTLHITKIGPAPNIVLPIGISFFTFQAISYIIDIYYKKILPPKSLIDFGTYLASFPQLIAGPIVRFSHIQSYLRNRHHSPDEVFEGLYRFCLGLGKKIIIADNIGRICDSIFKLSQNEMTSSVAWLGIICYTLQIYYDFSGYSDMAIGLGRIMGFKFPENFIQPYRSQNITEFWRRWHMTLTTWFRDYLYIPCGGNRKGELRTYLNLFLVFVLCGLWHGAASLFIFWGLYHGVLLVTERILNDRFNFRPSGNTGMVLTFFLIMIGWVFFRSNDLGHALEFLSTMFLPIRNHLNILYGIQYFLARDDLFYICLGIFFAFTPFEKIKMTNIGEKAIVSGKAVSIFSVFFISISMLSANGFNPFIYFQF
jgi:alginate O-acetyltransferase complex protein AlgI